jgi:hypothetical protein
LRELRLRLPDVAARARLEEPADDPERIAIREALAFGKALYVRTASACPSPNWL